MRWIVIGESVSRTVRASWFQFRCPTGFGDRGRDWGAAMFEHVAGDSGVGVGSRLQCRLTWVGGPAGAPGRPFHVDPVECFEPGWLFDAFQARLKDNGFG